MGLGLSLCALALAAISSPTQLPSPSPAPCKIAPLTFEGWYAQELSNTWVRLIVVPQLGGRVMQLFFNGHSYLYINAKYKGQYFPPLAPGAAPHWYNYGGDKIWPMPEGHQDEHHWPGPISDVLDDGDYTFKILSSSPHCSIRLDGPPDPRTGLQYSREISLDADSPEIRFHAIMKNIADHPIEWSVQSVTQYDTRDPQNPEGYNRDFWAFTPANPESAYLDRFHVRSGLADDPSFHITNNVFALHWLPLENEVWLDSPGGWLAVVDNTTHYGVVERFRFFPGEAYPGKATVILYKNGGGLELDANGNPALTKQSENLLRYMEAELNSPAVQLAPGQTYAMDTQWYPVRLGKDFAEVANAGVLVRPLTVSRTSAGIHITASFANFFPGQLQAWFADTHDARIGGAQLGSVRVNDAITIEKDLPLPERAVRVSIHLFDLQGRDRGVIAATVIPPADGSH